jgi:N-acetylglucosamine kinase-like BadF-type ATPase
MAAYFLGIDAGGSHTRAALVSEKGELVGMGFSGPANFRTKSFAESAQAIQEAVHQATRLVTRVKAVCIGTAGLEEQGTEEEGKELLGQSIEADTVLLDTDAYIAWAGALKAQVGVITIAGTGSISLGIDNSARRHRAGGWGPYFGDEGSAYAIANQAIREALKVLDGRNQDQDILKVLLSYANLPTSIDQTTSQRLTHWLYAKERSNAELANFARHIDQLALQGNACAKTILERAGQHLAELVKTIISQGDFTCPVPVSVGGSVLQHSSNTRQAFLNHLPSNCRFVEPSFPAVLGAAILAKISTSPQDETWLDALSKTPLNQVA